MNYYDETLEKIEELINNKSFTEAKRMILNELDLAYVPKDFEEKLNILLNKIKENSFEVKHLSDEDITDYLKMDENHQLSAVEELNNKNLRDYYDLCNSYLQSDGFINAKVLLIDSLIRQEINKEYKLKRNDEITVFNPSQIVPPEESDGFKLCLSELRGYFMKEPSMLQMAEQLLYKEALLSLPDNIDEKDSSYLAAKIEKFITDAFN